MEKLFFRTSTLFIHQKIDTHQIRTFARYIKTDKFRLDRILAFMGIGTRREVSKIIRKGRVQLNDTVIIKPGHKANPKIEKISIDEKQLEWKLHCYLMLHKPKGYITATQNKFGDAVVTDLLPEKFADFMPFPVGRLDKNTEGLLLLTTNGELLNRITHPKWHLPKKYYAELDIPLTKDDVWTFKKGMYIDGVTLKPAELIISETDPLKSNVIIHEGKYHQIERMFAQIGKKLQYLKRLEMGPVVLDPNLPVGEVRELTPKEIESLFTAVGLEYEEDNTFLSN